MVPPEIFDTIIKDTSIHFSSNDALVFYTDGVNESTNPEGEEYGTERLIDILRESGDKDAQGIIERTLDSVNCFSQGTGQAEDLTRIAVKHA